MQSLRAAWRALPRELRQLLAVALTVAAGAVTLTVVVSIDSDGDGTPDRVTTIHVDGPDADTKRDDPLPLGPTARDVVEDAKAAPAQLDLAGDLRGDDPQQAGVLEGPLAAQEWPGCRTRFVRNFSSRRGATPQLVWWHYTAGAERPGWGDVDGLTAYANSASSQVSWHFLIDREGHCNYTVPVQYKAWTEANANPTGIGIEVIGTGREANYAGTAGFKRLVAVTARITRLYPSIKLRLGTVKNCQPARSGIVTHWMGGSCSGGHVDIRPYDLPALIKRMQAMVQTPIRKLDRTLCRKLTWWRNAGRPGGRPERRAVARRKALERRHLSCVNGRVRRA